MDVEAGTGRDAGIYKLAEDEAIERLSKHTMELQQRANRLRPAEAPCQAERSSVLECYMANSKNPLSCAKMVAALDKCANVARQEVRITRHLIRAYFYAMFAFYSL
jgi:hypothetical protein